MSVGTKKKSTTTKKSAGAEKAPARAKAKTSGRSKPDAREAKSAAKGSTKQPTAASKTAALPSRRKPEKPQAAATPKGRAVRKSAAASKAKPRKRATAAANGHAHGTSGQPIASAESSHRDALASPETCERIRQGLFHALDGFVRWRQLGRVCEGGRFDWGAIEDPGLEPDLAFVSFDRFAPYRHVPSNLTWHVVPDLVVEIIRGSEETTPVSRWLEAYFEAGVRRVWVVYPDQLKIHDHESISSSRVIGRDETIDGADLLPGFELPLKDLESPHGD